jgi:type II secretory pathway component PulC
MAEALTTQSSINTSAGSKPFAFSLNGLSLALVNRILGMLTIAAAAYFVITLMIGGVKLIGVGQHIRGLEAKGAKAAKPVQERSATQVVVTDPALSNRNIFQPAGVVASASDASSSSMNPAGGYKLVGISQSSDPAETYVMVENSQTKLTYFLQYGQQVEGLELERILEDKVIVKIGGKSVELE